MNALAAQYDRRVVRLASAGLALTALALYVLTFAPWFKHGYYGTPRERFLENPDGLYLRLNGWQLYDTQLLTALILLAVFTAIGAAIWLLRRRGDPAGAGACGVALVAAVAALVRIADELRVPSDANYPHPVWGIYAALAAATALVLASLAATLVATRTARSRRQLRTVWPVVGGVAVVYGLALVASEAGMWIPETLVVFPIAGVLGYVVGRWAAALVPLPLGLVYGEIVDVEGLGSLVLYTVILLATGAVAAGVAAKVLQRRLAPAGSPVGANRG